jgi:predicted nucleotidyltransferase
MDNKIVEIVRLYAERVKELLPVEMVIIYGSHARGTASESSDIDVAVVVEKITGDYLQMSAELFRLVRSVNKRIEPILLCRSHDRSGFLESIMKKGKIVYKAEN